MSNKKILIVDDNADVRLGINIRLKANHYDTFVAWDGLSAISEARKVQPDLIILDLGMPAGGGFSVMERLKANPQLSTIPVIVLSGNDPVTNKERVFKGGAWAFLQKPVDHEKLLSAIRDALRQ